MGSRQDGREFCSSVIKVSTIKKDIVNAVNKQLKHGAYEVSSLYGSVGASLKIVNKIKELKPYTQKKINFSSMS